MNVYQKGASQKSIKNALAIFKYSRICSFTFAWLSGIPGRSPYNQSMRPSSETSNQSSVLVAQRDLEGLTGLTPQKTRVLCFVCVPKKNKLYSSQSFMILSNKCGVLLHSVTPWSTDLTHLTAWCSNRYQHTLAQSTLTKIFKDLARP